MLFGRDKAEKENGAVTVFLSFTFLLLMSLVLTLLEGARSRAAAAIADMQLTTCVESLLGEFYRPLYEKYNVFGIDTSFDGKVPDIEELGAVLTGFSGESSFGLKTEEGIITATRPFLTGDGGTFLKQVVDYEKYCAAVDTIGSLLERLGVLSKETEVYKIYERQMEIEDNLALIDKNTLLLMEKIDGPVCSGLTMGSVNELFVKSFMTRGIDPVSVGINNPDIWMLLEDKYYNPSVYVDNAMEKLEFAFPEVKRRDEIKEEISGLFSEREPLVSEINSAAEELSRMIDEEKKEFEDSQREEAHQRDTGDIGKKKEEKNKEEKNGYRESDRVASLREEIGELQKDLDELDKRICDLSEEKDRLNKSINDYVLTAGVHTDELMRRVSGCLLEAREAVELIEEDKGIIKKTRPMIESFASLLESSKEILSDEMYESLRLSLGRMKRFTGMDGAVPDFEKMEEALRTDVEVLGSIETDAFISADISRATLTEVSVENIGKWEERLQRVSSATSRFSYDRLMFDYSEMKPDRIICELSDGLKRTVANGFLDLLIGGGKVSEKKIGVRTRPSDLCGAAGGERTDAGALISEELGKESGAQSFLETDASKAVAGAGQSDESEPGVREKLLLILYIREHFGDYFDRVTSSQSALSYEQEYILCSNRSDSENLAQTASQIMLVRMVTSGAYVLSNMGLQARAMEIAESLVGFTGLHFLTLIVKYVILFAWSAEQALVETAAILEGKKVPILTTSASYCIDSFDLAAITPDGLREKVRLFRESEFSLLYGDYLCLFLLALPCDELSLKTMDMIEENMRWGYDGNFLLENCISGFDAKMVFSCRSRYIGIFDGLFADLKMPDGYGFVRTDSVDY